ncbi:MAG: hypothetical protein JW861_09565 [Bacteroidales bacterium]|nr:hypothetical protein [Bacteroidales bacterium]
MDHAGPEGVRIKYRSGELTITARTSEGITWQEISLPGHFLPGDAGAPSLPGNGRYLAIPNGSEARLEIISCKTDTVNDITVIPSPVIPPDSDTSRLQFIPDTAIYSRDAFYPEMPVRLSALSAIRGIDGVMLGITPFRYNPVRKILVVYCELELAITFEGGEGTFGHERYRSRWWDPLIRDVILNREMIPAPLPVEVLQAKSDNGCEYLIITPDRPEFLSWADSIRRWRTRQGILTRVMTIDGIGNRPLEIEEFIDSAYYGWDIPPSAVLLLSDYGNGDDGITSFQLAHSVSGRFVSDNRFADVDGDGLPDIAFARITANDEVQLERTVGKMLRYERTPPVNPGFYDHPVTAMGWETSRWFQLCSEIVNGFWEHGLGKQPVRENAIFYGTPGGAWSTALNTDLVVGYFGESGLGYIPDSTAHLTDWGGNAYRLNNDINTGAFMLQHRDHGFETGWGEPDYTVYDLPGLYNDDPVFVFSVNCLTGKFDWENECFAEAFHRHPFGALGIIAATEESFSFVNDTYVWGMYDYMWPQFMPDYGSFPEHRGVLPCFANMAGKYFLGQSGWPYNTEHKQITYQLFHYHGGAFSTVYTLIPQPLNITLDSTVTCTNGTLGIQADSGAFIAVTLEDDILATATADGLPQTITLPFIEPACKLNVCATLQDRYRHELLVPVVPPEGPFVTDHACLINDSLGDGNHRADAGEWLFLTFTMKNAGNLPADDVTVTISTGQAFVTLTDTTASYGPIPPGELKSVWNGFAMKVDENTPDGSEAELILRATGNGQTWESRCGIGIHAPSVQMAGYCFIETSGNGNMVPEAGEELLLKTGFFNSGTAAVYHMTCTLESMHPLIAVPDSVYVMDTLEPGGDRRSEFRVFIDPQLTGWEEAGFICHAEGPAGMVSDTFTLFMNRCVEDWEWIGGERFPWEREGDALWEITTRGASQGDFSARTGYVTDNQHTSLILNRHMPQPDSISFRYKVSSELNWDYLEFYIDTVMAGEWCGEVEWSSATFPVSAGDHTFTWVYSKDMYVFSGDDCAWLDRIVLPPAPFVSAGDDDTICEGGSCAVDGCAAFFTSVLWNTLGDGIFDHPDSLSTFYHPGLADLDAGMASLILCMEYVTGILCDTMNLMINRLPAQPEPPEGDTSLCQAPGTVIYTIAQIPFADSCLWVLSPPDAGTVTPAGYTCAVSWTPDYTGSATLIVRGVNECGEGMPSDPLEIVIHPLPVVTLEPFPEVCLNDPPFPLEGGMPEGGIYNGPGVYNGWFYPAVAGLGVHSINYEYTSPEGCAASDQGTIIVSICTGSEELSQGDIRIYPNPASGTLFVEIQLNVACEMELLVFDEKARPVCHQRFFAEAGMTRRSMEIPDPGPGLYSVVISGSHMVRTIKVILKP